MKGKNLKFTNKNSLKKCLRCFILLKIFNGDNLASKKAKVTDTDIIGVNKFNKLLKILIENENCDKKISKHYLSLSGPNIFVKKP